MRFLVALLVGCSSPVCYISFLASRCYITSCESCHVTPRSMSDFSTFLDVSWPKRDGPNRRKTWNSKAKVLLKCPKKHCGGCQNLWICIISRIGIPQKISKDSQELFCLRNMRAFFIRCSTHHQLRHCWLKMLRMGFVNRLLKTYAGCSLWMAGRV